MSVKVDYLVVCSNGADLIPILAKLLEDAIKTIYNEGNIIYDQPPEEEELRQYIAINYTKNRDDGRWIRRFSVDFDIASVDFDIASEEMGKLIREFSTTVAKSADDGIENLLKLNDPQLQCTLRRYGDEIFEIEMKLREALSLIFVNTYYDEDFYDLLNEVNVNFYKRESPERMRKYYENQFFYLSFSEYKRINESKPASKVSEILKQIEEAKNFGDLQQIIAANPIQEDRYATFLVSLTDQVESIELLRNCVAHNKPIPERTLDNYNKVSKPLLKSINDFLEEEANLEVDGETETG